MPYLGNRAGSKARVNVLKKVKVDGEWKLCAAIIERDGKLKDKVRVNGQVKVHSEGVYYIEWRQDNQRRRQAAPNRNHVLKRARLKALELDAKKAGIPFDESPLARRVAVACPTIAAPTIELDQVSSAAGAILRGVESYLREVVNAAVQSQLAKLGIAPNVIPAEPASSSFALHHQQAEQHEKTDSIASQGSEPRGTSKTLIAKAIEEYLKDVAPPQREQKTYDEYRLVLYKFRDTCNKQCLQDVDRDDCLSFMRHLYSIGNEARTVFNRMGIVQQLFRLHGITGLLKPRDKPKFVSNVREMYRPEELEALFKICSPDERVLYLFFSAHRRARQGGKTHLLE